MIPISLPEWNRTLPKIHQSNLQRPRGRFCVESRQNVDFLSKCDNIRTVVQVLKSRSQCDLNFLVLASFSVGFFSIFRFPSYLRTFVQQRDWAQHIRTPHFQFRYPRYTLWERLEIILVFCPEPELGTRLILPPSGSLETRANEERRAKTTMRQTNSPPQS